MKYIKLVTIAFLIFGCQENDQLTQESKELIVVEQDFGKALEIAAQEEKLLFIDFYTSWCAPCKKLDQLVFQNDSIKEVLGEDFVMLKYDAENDTVFHLSKKHHVSSYPTGIVLNEEGFILNRKYGFPGQDSISLRKSVLEFTDESIKLNEDNSILSGYSNVITPSKYPKFYVDYVNRTNTKIDATELSDYFVNTEDKFSEAYFSTLIYFGRDAPVSVADVILDNKQRYIDLYGKNDVDILLYALTTAKFNAAISEIDQDKYDQAVEFAKNALSAGWVEDILPMYEKDYLKAQNKWDEVLEINKRLKSEGEFDNGYINYFSWQVYEECDNQDVIEECLEWMKQVTNQEPNYAYLDTYAHLMNKSGNKTETKRIANLAIEAAKKENKSTETLEELIQAL
ncbi:MAG: thioredoxin family protein [Bacteroidota bacterium]